MTMTYEEEVTRGAQLLDQHAPADWRDRLDLNRLRMGDVTACVVGQTFDVTGSGLSGGDRPYQSVLVELGSPPPGPRGWASAAQLEWQYEHGLDVRPDDDGYRDYATLTATWRAYLRGTRSATTPPDEEDQT